MMTKPKILIIEDDINGSKSLSFILEKKNYETSIVHTGFDAISIAQKNFFDIVLMDLKLPDILGTELIRPLKAKNPEVDILLMTAFASIKTAVKSLNEGVCAYITKPLNIDELLSILKKTVEK